MRQWNMREQTGLWVDERSVSPVIATILMVAVVVVIAASIGAVAFGFTDKLGGTSVAPGEGQCVVQSVEFNPADVDSFAERPYDCVMWFDASQDDFSSDTSISRWRDRSGNGFDATTLNNGDVANPRYGSVDGVSAVEFDDFGSTDGAGLTTDVDAGIRDIEEDTEITVTTMVWFDPTAGTIFQVGTPELDGFVPVEYFRFGYADVASNDWFVTTGEGFFGHGPDDVDGEWHVVTYVHNGTGVTAYINGEKRGTKAGELDISDGPIRLGHEERANGDLTDYYGGYIAELAVFETALNDDEREALECAMDDKYNNAVTVSHC